MKNQLLRKHCTMLLLAVVAAAWSTPAWAGIKIYVRTEGGAAGTAPNLYVWNEAREPINGSWPGTQMSKTTTTSDGTTWYYEDFTATNIGAIINNYSGKTADLEGIKEDRYYSYKGGSEYYNLTNQYVIPENATFVEGKKFVYFVNTSEWATPHAHVYNSGGNITGNWPGEAMTKVENSVNLWKWEKSTTETPANIIFNDGGSNQSATMAYTNGGYYNAAEQVTTITQMLLNSTNFPDPNFRAALAEALNVNEGDNIYPNNVKVLDVSNKGISDLTGIANFTNLEELYAQNNTLNTNVDLKNNKKLRILNISGNSAITGFSANYAPYVDINFGNGSNTTNLKELYCANCSIYYAGGLQYNTGLKVLSMPHNVLDYFSSTTMRALSNLEYLDMSYNKLTSSQSLSNNTKLIYVDVSENPTFNSYFSHLEKLTQLKTFKAANCKLTADQTKYSSTNGYFPNESVEYVDVSNNPALNTMYCPATNNLKTIIANGCTGLGGSSSSCALSPTSGGTYLPRMTHLEHLELSNVDLYLNTGNSTYGLFSLISPSVAPNLHYIDLSNDQLGSLAKPVFGFPKLETLLLNNNPDLTLVTVKDLTTPENLQINVTSDNALATIAINNSGLDGTNIPTIIGWDYANAILNYNSNNFSNIPTVPSNVSYLYLQNNIFGSGDYTLPTTSLVGLDLGNNGFTKFKAENNTSLMSLALSPNNALTEIELHGNTALTQTSPDGVIESNNGLYIKGLSSLQTLNIENSSFSKLGQQNSLQGVTGLKTLKARHNEFTTFTNGVYPVGVQGTGSYRIADPSESSLEHLIGLEYLDLSYNELRDSVHLYRNVALKHLDVSHNNHITGVFDGSITTEAQKTAMLEKKAYHLMKYGNVYQSVGTNPTNSDWTNGYINFQKRRSRPFDLRTEDLNDTTGLYHLDLGQNVNLEWLDFSYTNIHNTASKPEMMNTGWMDKDWVTDMGTWDARSSSNTTTKRAYTSWHTYVYFIPCSKLKVIHADHNNMQSLGIRYFPKLDTLTCSYMYGDCAFMRDFSTNSALSSGTVAITDAQVLIGMGNISLSTTIQELKSVTWSTDKNGNPTSTLTWQGPDGTDNTYFPNPIKHFDVSYSGYNEIRFYPGNVSPDLPNLEHINVSGNPLNCQVKHYSGATELDYSNVSNYNSLDVTYCPNIRTVLAENCSDLPIIRAHNRTKLDTLYLSNDPNLKTLYVQNDPLLKTNLQGLNTLTGLETLFGYNNTHWGNDITFASNTALKNLWISNIGASQLDVSANTALEKLRAYDNSLTALNLSGNANLQWLDVARNKLPDIDLSANTALQFFNISNGTDNRTQLDGTEQLNHDGSDGDAIKPTTIFSADEAPIANANNGNSLSDLALPASIVDARANGNDLHSITGSFANLTNIEFAHNHINGIDLSAAPGATIESRDNGRTIVADFATFKVKDNNNQIQEYKVYFFQLENPDEPNGTILTDKESKDLKLASRHLGDDGLALNNISNWGSNNSGILTKSGTTVTPDNMGDILDPDQIPGKIVVLVPEDVNESTNEASGHATYTYTTGAGSEGSEFYLNWTSNGTVTGLNIVGMSLDNVSITNTYGNLTVTGADGTVVGVYDLNGRQVASETIINGSVTIDGLTPGIYVVNGVKVLVK